MFHLKTKGKKLFVTSVITFCLFVFFFSCEHFKKLLVYLTFYLQSYMVSVLCPFLHDG